tara:strand:+ start:535 stop:1050 length:516 start_codon:yes stop_codon:yes gene_type:complete
MSDLEALGLDIDNPVLGIFGTKSFVNPAKGEMSEDRRRVLRKLVMVLKQISPVTTYITPEGKTGMVVIKILQALGIPYTIVLPCRNYFTGLTHYHRNKMEYILEKSSSIVLLSEETKNLKNVSRLRDNAENFILERADLLISVYGRTVSKRYKNLNKKLNNLEADVIFLNY